MKTTMDPAGGNFGQIDGAGLLRHEQAGKLNYRLSKLIWQDIREKTYMSPLVDYHKMISLVNVSHNKLLYLLRTRPITLRSSCPGGLHRGCCLSMGQMAPLSERCSMSHVDCLMEKGGQLFSLGIYRSQ
jgi:hypothetical protein